MTSTAHQRDTADPAARRRLVPPERFDLARTIRMLELVPFDPTVVSDQADSWWATITPDGAGSLRLSRTCGELLAEGYGPGATWLIDRADAIAGLRDDLGDFPALADRHPVVRRLAKVHAGLRFPATGRVFHHCVPAVLGQKVTREAARTGYVGLVRRLASPAPGPNHRLWLPPAAQALASCPYWDLHPFGVERRRAETLSRAGIHARKLDAAPDSAEATRRLTLLPGIGPWTAAEVVRVAFGDPDAVSTGDFHLPHTVASALAGISRGSDPLMLELLEPFRGHRGRVCQLLHASGQRAQRFGPRLSVASIADL